MAATRRISLLAARSGTAAPDRRSSRMGLERVLAVLVLATLIGAGRMPLHLNHATAAILPTQLLPGHNQTAEPDEGDSEDDEDDEQGSSTSEDMQDGVLRPPRTGDDEAVKVPPAERLPPSPAEKPKRE